MSETNPEPIEETLENSSNPVTECPLCGVFHWTVQSRNLLVDLEPDHHMDVVSCWGCSQNIIARTHARYGIQCCDFCDQYRKDVELRDVYVDTDQNTEEVLCCGSCETDRLMSV